jgi:hypothetical protein
MITQSNDRGALARFFGTDPNAFLPVADAAELRVHGGFLFPYSVTE